MCSIRPRAQFGHQMCSADEFREMRASLVRIERDALSQIVVRTAR
jgi:hypothetical protein